MTRLASWILEALWHLRSPSSPEGCARDFVDNRLRVEGVQKLASLCLEQLNSDNAFALDQLRRIAYIYGLAQDRTFTPAWNRSLIRKLGGRDAQEAAVKLLVTAQEVARARSLVVPSQATPEVRRGGTSMGERKSTGRSIWLEAQVAPESPGSDGDVPSTSAAKTGLRCAWTRQSLSCASCSPASLWVSKLRVLKLLETPASRSRTLSVAAITASNS
jgi:hypothetical protein